LTAHAGDLGTKVVPGVRSVGQAFALMNTYRKEPDALHPREEVSASTQPTSASAQEISASAQELAATAQPLESLVRRFKVEA
jgi:hypothetical protein